MVTTGNATSVVAGLGIDRTVCLFLGPGEIRFLAPPPTLRLWTCVIWLWAGLGALFLFKPILEQVCVLNVQRSESKLHPPIKGAMGPGGMAAFSLGQNKYNIGAHKCPKNGNRLNEHNSQFEMWQVCKSRIWAGKKVKIIRVMNHRLKQETMSSWLICKSNCVSTLTPIHKQGRKDGNRKQPPWYLFQIRIIHRVQNVWIKYKPQHKTGHVFTCA
jgi:hypothetical protein